MRIDQLHQIIIVSEAKSINAAARHLYISQSSLSASISAMEKELDRDLLLRSHDGVSLTKYGKSFVEAAKEILSIYNNVLDLPIESDKGKLHISSQFLLYASSIFASMHSECENNVSSFRFTEKTSSGVIQDIINRTSEIGLIVTRTEYNTHYKELADRYGLDYHVISTDICQCLVGKGSPLYNQKSDCVSIDQLKRFPLVRYEQDSTFIEKSIDFDRKFLFPHTGLLVISDTGSLQNILARTNGYFVGIHNTNAYSVTDFYENIRVLKVLDKAFTYDTAWLQIKGQHLTPLAEKFLRKIYHTVGNSSLPPFTSSS